MKKLVLTTAMMIMSPASFADFLGIYFGTGYWDQSFGGDISTFNTALDIEGDLGVEDNNGINLFVALEHPIPLLPNIRLSTIELESDGTKTLEQGFRYGDVTYNANVNTTTTFDLSHTELVLYYEILDNWVTLDIGVSTKFFDGFLEISAEGGLSERVDLDKPLPMLFARAAFELPFTGWRVDVEGGLISIADNSIYDFSAEVAYETSLGLGAELGYRVFGVDVDEFSDDLVVETEFGGIYANIYYHF